MMQPKERMELDGGKKNTKCFRFPSQAISELEYEAKRKSISLNSLMNKLIMTYLKWGRFVERYGGTFLCESSLSALINEIDDTAIEKAGLAAGAKTPRRLLLMLGVSPKKENVLRLVDIICEHSISYRFDHKIIDNRHQFLVTHALGVKWSKWFASYLKSMFNDLLGVGIEVSADEDSVSFNI